MVTAKRIQKHEVWYTLTGASGGFILVPVNWQRKYRKNVNSALHTPFHAGSNLSSIHAFHREASLGLKGRITAGLIVTSQEGPLKDRDKRLQAPPRLSMAQDAS